MFELLSSTPAKVALATLGTAVVATGSYLIGQHHGIQKGMQSVLEKIAAAQLDSTEAPEN